MTEPVTNNLYLIVPNTSDLPGAWATSALNPNFQSIDAKLSGTTTISLSSTTTILLTVPATTGVWPGGNPSQSMQALIKFTGAQTGSATIQFTLPGFYIIDNRCTGTTFVKLSPASGGGNSIGAPPGEKCHVFFDGTDMDYVNLGRVGSPLDLHINTTTLPPWMTACSVSPYLVKDGSVYTSSVYPALSALLGSTFGGNGVTTFGVPDERSRTRLGVDTIQAASGATAARITFAQAGFTGSLLGAAGGTSISALVTANTPPYTPVGGVSSVFQNIAVPAAGPVHMVIATTSGDGATGAGNTFAGTLGGGTSAPFSNVGPGIVSCLPLIKT
jgi:microcystin-dependent protein